MKLVNLEIRNLRGIRDLTLRPAGNNLAIWGPNGSGKSTIVDAIDFLLTGKIARLEGRGTGGISLTQHGRHIDAVPGDAAVRGVFQLSGVSDPVVVSRCMADPGRLVIEHCSNPLAFERARAVAARGQHMLTRRDILHYITAEPRERAVQVQALLNVSPVEGIRTALVKVHGELQRAAASERAATTVACNRLAAAVEEPRFDPGTVLVAINRYRSMLGGSPLQELVPADLKTGLTAPGSRPATVGPNLEIVRGDVSRLQRALSDALLTAERPRDQTLRQTLRALRADPLTQRAADWQRMAMLGLSLMDDDGACPLCGVGWDPGVLQERIEAQLAVSVDLQEKLREITETSSHIKRYTDQVVALARSVHTAATALGDVGVPALQTWIASLEQLADCLNSPLELYPDSELDACGFFEVLTADEIPDLLQSVLATAEAMLPQTTPEQTAWDLLTRIEVTLQAVVEQTERKERAELAHRRADLLLEDFVGSRDAVLDELYRSVNDRFVQLYRQIHGEDEHAFAASLVPDGAGLDLTVSFHGRGSHPPHALHSEGHQDSMGICLFLALSEELAANLLDLVVLDDVVMSVDSDHRRQVGQLLAEAFPGKQFLVLTHDRTWCNQLKSAGVVTNRTTINFFNWSLSAGPHVSTETDQWEQIERDLGRGDVGSAAAKLRRGAEEFFGAACDALRGRVPYKLNGRWELGDFLPAAVGAYRDHLRAAKRAARSWEDGEAIERIEELESTLVQIYARSTAEQWVVNAAVHYNEWARLAPEDFRAVVEAFHDLFGVFRCARCEASLYVAVAGFSPTNLRCSCGAIDLNLADRPRNTRSVVE